MDIRRRRNIYGQFSRLGSWLLVIVLTSQCDFKKYEEPGGPDPRVFFKEIIVEGCETYWVISGYKFSTIISQNCAENYFEEYLVAYETFLINYKEEFIMTSDSAVFTFETPKYNLSCASIEEIIKINERVFNCRFEFITRKNKKRIELAVIE